MDTGGTFTDCIAHSPSGHVHRLKVLSSSVLRGRIVKHIGRRKIETDVRLPVLKDIFKGFQLRIVGTQKEYIIAEVDVHKGIITLQQPIPSGYHGKIIEITSNEEVPVLAARLITQTPLNGNFPELDLKLGSTRGTNAILERKGAATAFLVTKGFKDLLLIGDQQRPDLFTVHIQKKQPLYKMVFEVDERIGSNGEVVRPLNPSGIRSLTRLIKKKGIESVAIALVNSYKNPLHEEILASALKKEGFNYVSSSQRLSSQIKILSRAETAVANAYLDPIIHSYLTGIKKGLSGADISIMTSSGSLVKSDSFFPKDSLLSGPAGGVVGAAHQAGRSGIDKILAFDMGGTSTDVSMYNGRFDYRFQSRVGNFSILSPSLAIETIAAGGGSICDFDGYRLTVGPHSAGASPGPACYGAGGPLTITDVNLLLGRIHPDFFAIPIQIEASEKALKILTTRLRQQSRKSYKPYDVLESFAQIANEKMAEAIGKISIQQGHDPRDFTLLSFGGAGGQHACALAGMLGMTDIITPYDAGLLSACGIGNAAIERLREKLILQPWEQFEPVLNETLKGLFEEASASLQKDGHALHSIHWNRNLIFIRFAGQDSSIEIDFKPGANIPTLFRKKYISIFGHWTDRPLEVESIRVIASIKTIKRSTKSRKVRTHTPVPLEVRWVVAGGVKSRCLIYRWEDLRPGAHIAGPALIISDNSTTFVANHWDWKLDEHANALMVKRRKAKSSSFFSNEAELELFTNRFTALAQEMGAILQRTSFSVNVKERLDFSCALLDSEGYLVVNAPHIPVHLGSMGVCVREVCKVIGMHEGDVVITNHPAYGGSHLPDVTLIKPIFYAKELVGFVANRAHHAEIGGSKPGSMPADATTLEEEGVIIAPTYLVKNGKAQWDKIKILLSSARFPSRAVHENLADLHGALAAVNLGEQGLQMLCGKFGKEKVRLQMKSLRKYASALLRKKIRSITKNHMTATEYLDDGSVLRVKMTKNADRLRIDFTGSSAVHPGNLNATRAIVQSVVLYSLRLLVNQSLPMNEGLMEPIDLILPQGLLNPDFSREPLPAVVGGNTEVSQRLTDTMLKAFGLAACSQGTMNNFLFGNERFGYYETICGGTGAGEGFDGADAVHQHMTNTRITDPEIIEFRYPVRLERFAIRANSGGKGKWHGGNGVIREILFNEALEVNLLTQHRIQRPYGMEGGGSGKTGDQILFLYEGHKKLLAGVASATVKAGDRLVIKTPGGGAWGRVEKGTKKAQAR